MKAIFSKGSIHFILMALFKAEAAFPAV